MSTTKDHATLDSDDAKHLPNSFGQLVTDWQNIPDVKEFFEKDILEEGQSRVTFSTSFGNTDTKVDAGLTVGSAFRIAENLNLTHKFDHHGERGTKTLGFNLSEEQIKFQYDTGFRSSGKHSFNPYYKLSFFRDPFVFRKFTVGLNYGEEDQTVTHLELSLMEHQKEFKLRFRNSYLITWRIFKFCSVNLLSYGKAIESSQEQVFSIHPHEKVKGYLVIKNLINKDSSYDFGTKVDFNKNVAGYLNMHINPFLQYSFMGGIGFSSDKGMSGKMILNELREANFSFSTDVIKQCQLAFLAKIPLNRLDPASPAWGLNLSVNF